MKGPFKNATKLENELHAMSSEERTAWIQKKLENYQEMSLPVKMRKGTGAPFQVPRHKRFYAPHQRRAAVLAGLKQKFKKKHLRLVKYNENQWISQMFVKFKGRIDPDTLMEAFRALTDLRTVNDNIDYPKFWEQMCNTIDQMVQTMPEYAEWFASEDISDAYEGMMIAMGDTSFLTCVPPIQLKWSDFTVEELKEWSSLT